MKMPGLFLVGAPRCGTTALSRYLAGHPHICFSEPKEPNYFIACSDPLDPENLQRHYLQRFFSHCRPEHQMLGEGSVSYLYSSEAIEAINTLNPEAKFIVSVRNPLDMIPSYHARTVYNTDESCLDLETAWSLQGVRARGEQIPSCCREPRLLQYAQIGMCGKYLERLISIIARERIKVLVFDDLKSDSTAVYREVLAFLGLEDDGREVSGVIRGNQRFRSLWLQRLLKQPPFISKGRLVKRTGGMPGIKLPRAVKRIRSWLLGLNHVDCAREPLSDTMREALVTTFSADVAKLEQLLDRDLGHWLAPVSKNP